MPERQAVGAGALSAPGGRFQVRRKATSLTAYRAARAGDCDLPDGHTVPIRPGDIVITRGSITLAVRSYAQFIEEYDVLTPGTLTLSAADCQRIEGVTGLGSTASTDALATAVERLAALRIGEVRIPFTPGQLEELHHRALKRGRSLAAEMQAVVDRVQDEIFHRGG